MKTMLNVKTDSKLKKEAQKVAKEAGIPISLVVNNALKRFVSHRSITIQAPLVPNEKTGRELKKILAEIKAGKYKKWPSFDSMDNMIDYLHSK